MSLQDNKDGFQRPLPPPPSLPLPPPTSTPPSSTTQPTPTSMAQPSSNGSSGGRSKLLSSLPPPPKIAFTPSKTATASSAGMAPTLPPPPKIGIRQPAQPPQQPQQTSAAIERMGAPRGTANLSSGTSGIDTQMDKLSLKEPNKDTKNVMHVHSTREQIPTLSSAPPSNNGSFNFDSGEYSASGAGNQHGNIPTGAIGRGNIPAAPSSNASWASGFLDKAGQLAYTTVGSAADLASEYLLDERRTDEGFAGGESEGQPFEQQPFGLAGQVGQFQQFQPGQQFQAQQQFQQQQSHHQQQQFQQQRLEGVEIADISMRILQQNQLQQEQQTQRPAFQNFDIPVDPPQQLNIDMSSPTISPTPPSALPTTKPIPTPDVVPPLTVPKKPKRACSNPPLNTLAPRQSLLKVLIVPTADAQTIATKNNTTLCDMFRVYGNNHGDDPKKQYCPPLPPFRSAHRSMMLNWENLQLDFMSSQEMECRPVSEGVAEKALGEAARLWDEDLVDEADGGLERLEKCVADCLGEEEEEERIRKMDGIVSMSSRKAKKGELPYGEGEEFRNENENLINCADAAFGLTTHPSTPWLLRLRHTLDRSTDGMSHEMLCNPSVVILAASTSENYLICFAELANVHHLPRPYHDGRYDPNGLRREFLLLHDVCSGPKNFDETKALAMMKERFGPGCCSVLRVNSLIGEEDLLSDTVAKEDEEWELAGPSSPFAVNQVSEMFRASLGGGGRAVVRGACLSEMDKRAIRRYVANMVATGLVPAVERRIANLNAAVSNAKRGVKNVIKSLWRKPKESLLTNVSGYSDGQKESNLNEQTFGAIKYRFDSIESQTRLLADTLFLMRDYDAALGVYRLVKDDYKHDKAILYYASVQEMILLCMHMLDPYGDGRFASDVFHSIETALYSYTRAADEERETDNGSGVRPGEAPYATRLATRLCLVLSSTRSLTEGKHMEIADLLASASSHETPLGAAVLLEQSSAHYYRAGMLRKFAFHMLMAGHMFRSAGQEHHAFRCFAASLYVYHGERWDELRSHLRTALAAQLYGMGQFALSMQFYAKLISAGGGRVSVRSQQKFLNHIVDICKDHQSSAIVAVDRMNTISEDSVDDGGTEHIKDIVNGLTSAVRTIEISNLGFPRVDEKSIRVCVENTRDSCISIGRSDSTLSKHAVSTSKKGDEGLWQGMINCAEAELRASAMSSTPKIIENTADGGPAQPTAHSGDETIDRVIMEIDKEERDAEYRERQKRKGKGGSPEVRATSEPIAVSFVLFNPLGIDIDLTEVQVVATLECQKSGMRHTNEFAVSDSESDFTRPYIVNFYGSDKEYQSPEFMCQLPTVSDFSSRVTTLVKDSDPHFVVTKVSVTVRANSETVVSLNICPLVEGDLKVLGFRCKLLDQVWIYHRFDLLGPLLQDTQINKAKRARGESLVLRSRVEQKMPFLKVSLVPDTSLHGIVLQGQTSHWKLKLSNLGYAPASNIMLKTNAPWLNISETDDAKVRSQNEDASTSFCIGPSGTLMQVPIKGALGHLGVLQPGETTEVPIVIRTSGGGRQDFYMLFRYELWEAQNEVSNLAPRHRWAREILSIPVYPSITMSASLMPSYSNKGEHLLSIELMNYRSDRDTKLEINLGNVCIASRNFQVQQLEGQVYPDDNSKASTLQIGWQERLTLHYLVVPIETNTDSSTIKKLPCSSDDTIACENILQSKNRTHVIDFMCRERAHEVFTEMLRTHRVEKERLLAEQEKQGQPRHVAQIRRARTSIPKDESETLTTSSLHPAATPVAHPTSITSLCPPDGTSNINIICCWSALVGNEGEDKTVHGQHHLRNLMVRPHSKSKGCPLALTAKHQSQVSHNFDSSPLDVDLEVTVRNRLVEADVEFEFALEDHQSSFDFVGTSSFTWKLFGGDEIIVPLKARIYSGGLYNLQRVRLTVIKRDSSVPYLFPLQWTVMVEDV